MAKARNKQNRYSAILEAIFCSKFKKGMEKVEFQRVEIEKFSKKLKIELPKNIGDLIYSFRYRSPLPTSIRSKTPKGKMWIIRPAGRARYKFALIRKIVLKPTEGMVLTKIPDATPGIVEKYAFGDEQALLAKLRYNRLIDVFTGVMCYSLQNHLRTTVPHMGQVETDEIYVGINKKGVHYVFPLQAKGGKDKLNIVQIEQDFAVCKHKFSQLTCRPIGTQFLDNEVIVLFEFEQTNKGVGISSEKHYKLVPPEDVSDSDLASYKARTGD